MTVNTATKVAVRLMAERDAHDVELALAFHAYWRAAQGDTSVRDTALDDLGRDTGFEGEKTKKARYFKNVAQFFLDGRNLLAARIKELGWAKLAILYSVRTKVDPEHFERLLDLANTEKIARLRREIAKLHKRAGGPQGEESPARVSIPMTASQKACFEDALAVCAAQTGEDAQGYNLSLLSMRVLAGDDAQILPAELLGHFERVLGCKIIAFHDPVVARFVTANRESIVREAHRSKGERRHRKTRQIIERQRKAAK